MNATAMQVSSDVRENVTSVELLDPAQMAGLDGGNIPLPPLWILAGSAGGLFVGGVIVGVAVYYYQTR